MTPAANNRQRNISGSSSRPKTPPSNPSLRTRPVEPSPLQRSSGPKSPPFKSYMNFLSNTNDDWNTEEDEMGYDDDDGDDFGLPSLSNMKRRNRKMAAQQQSDTAPPPPTSFSNSFGSYGRHASDSADIAVERPISSYPMPRKSEGKILRPQYKDILKGKLENCQLAKREADNSH